MSDKNSHSGKNRGLREDAAEFRRKIGEKEILARIRPGFFSETEALEWYRTQKLPGFGGKTPMDLVHQGRGASVLNYLDAVAAGVHA